MTTLNREMERLETDRRREREREREIDYAVGLPCLTRKNRLASGEERDGKEEGERHLAVGL